MSEVPYLDGKQTPAGIVVDCPFCKKPHNHGRDKGRREALCGKGAYVIIVGATKAPITKPETPFAKKRGFARK